MSQLGVYYSTLINLPPQPSFSLTSSPLTNVFFVEEMLFLIHRRNLGFFKILSLHKLTHFYGQRPQKTERKMLNIFLFKYLQILGVYQEMLCFLLV